VVRRTISIPGHDSPGVPELLHCLRAQHQWRLVQRQIADKLSSTTAGACHNYYHSASGKNVTQWPLSHTAYWAALRVLPLWGFVTTRYDRRRAAEPIRASADAAQ
jgi:hypothetical protein